MSGLRVRIRDALKFYGAMSTDELAEHLDAKNVSVRAVVSMLRASKKKVIYIKEWVRNTNASGVFYLRARYALGNRADAKKPEPLTASEYNRRCRARRKRVVRSVFDLGKPVDSLRVGSGASIKSLVKRQA